MGAQFGFELMNIRDNGGDFFMGPTASAIKLNAIQVDMSLACSGGNSATPNVAETGFAQVLFYGFISPKEPTFGGNAIDGFNDPTDPVWGTYSISDPNGIAAGGNGASADALLASILKAWFPQPCNRSLVVPLFGLAVPAGSYFVLHADHTGFEADFEAQGVIHYAIA
jgi:hypothetical protein